MRTSHATSGRGTIRFLGQSAVLEILEALAVEPKCVKDVAEELELEPSNVSRVLRQLRLRGYVDYVGHKKEHVFRLTAKIGMTLDDRATDLSMEVGDGLLIHVSFRSRRVEESPSGKPGSDRSKPEPPIIETRPRSGAGSRPS